VLAVIGLGVGTFASALFQGAKTVAENPVVQDATDHAKDAVKDKVKESVSGALG
jgi:hypothetical protein